MSVCITLYLKPKAYKDIKIASFLLSLIINSIYYLENNNKFAFSYVKFSINNSIFSYIDNYRYYNLIRLYSIKNYLSYSPSRKEMLYLVEGSVLGNCSFCVGDSYSGSFIRKIPENDFYSINLFNTTIFRLIYSNYDLFDAYYGKSVMDIGLIGKPMNKYVWY